MIRRVIGFVAAVSTVMALGWPLHTEPASAAACPKIKTTYGTATVTYTVPVDGTYRLWSRIQAASKTANSYYLQIDASCPVVVGDKAIPSGELTWIDYRDAKPEAKIEYTLGAGPHTFILMGREAGVVLDRVVLAPKPDCVPTGIGDNCGLEVTPSPTVSASPTTSATAHSNSGTNASGGGPGSPYYAGAAVLAALIGGGSWWWLKRHKTPHPAPAATIDPNQEPTDEQANPPRYRL